MEDNIQNKNLSSWDLQVLLNKKNSVKIGDIFFIDSKDLDSYAVYECTDTVDLQLYHGLPQISNGEKNIKLAVKYIGNGVFEEMVTHQKILSSNNKGLIDYEVKDPYKIGYNDFSDDDEMHIEDFIKYCEELKQKMVNNPITFHGAMERPSDEMKKEYIKNTDDERKEVIKRALENSKKNIEDAIKVVDHQISLASDLTKEKLDMAYLENQLYDFQKENNEGGKTL